jgi:hypothetical protein
MYIRQTISTDTFRTKIPAQALGVRWTADSVLGPTTLRATVDTAAAQLQLSPGELRQRRRRNNGGGGGGERGGGPQRGEAAQRRHPGAERDGVRRGGGGRRRPPRRQRLRQPRHLRFRHSASLAMARAYLKVSRPRCLASNKPPLLPPLNPSSLPAPFPFVDVSYTRSRLCASVQDERGCDICGVVITDDAKPVTAHPFRRSTAFLFGNEVGSLVRFSFFSHFG